MTDRPIIFSAPMIRALLDGRKTMTRRLAWREFPKLVRVVNDKPRRAPSPWQRVQPGDRLWVRERFSGRHEGWSVDHPGGPIWYWADGNPRHGDWTKPKPSIHMPRWASRLTLTVTATKIERLQDISERDAVLEGVYCVRRHENDDASPTQLFAMLWCNLHGDDSWNANPEVVALTFTVEKRNIDALKEAA